MICINLGVRTQEEKSREESRDDTPQFTKRRIINKEDQEGVQAKTRWCRRNFSEKGIRDRESSINQDTGVRRHSVQKIIFVPGTKNFKIN